MGARYRGAAVPPVDLNARLRAEAQVCHGKAHRMGYRGVGADHERIALLLEALADVRDELALMSDALTRVRTGTGVL
jgi:lactam utilization protein B